MSSRPPKDQEYYPLRWKFADFVENVIILHRTKVAAAVAVFGALILLVGLVLLGWGPFGGDEDTEDVAAQNETATEATEAPPVTLDPDSVRRVIATDEQVTSTPAGLVIELGPRTMRVLGGASSDEVADGNIELATTLFAERELLDDQLLSSQFAQTPEIIVRVVEPTLFDGETALVNPDLAPLLVDVATAVAVNPTGTGVLVVGHAPTGALGLERAEAVANELVAQGLAIEQVSFTSVGNSEPLPGIDSRIEFILR